MSNSEQQLLSQLADAPDTIAFADVMAVISEHYEYSPSRFHNGLGDSAVCNEAGSNEGSCKLFAFAQLNGLDQAQTLALFGDYYRIDVLQHPNGDDHSNIRQFMQHGWDGIRFDAAPLARK